MKGERRSRMGEGENLPDSAFSPPYNWRCTAICEETNTRIAIICPTSYVMWRLFTRHANLCGGWCMCFFSPVITSMELQSNALHLISSTGCAPRWVRDSLQDGFWHTAQPRRIPAWILYSAFHHSHPLWIDQSRWIRWIRILIECLGAVIKKNDYIFPKCIKK